MGLIGKVSVRSADNDIAEQRKFGRVHNCRTVDCGDGRHFDSQQVLEQPHTFVHPIVHLGGRRPALGNARFEVGHKVDEAVTGACENYSANVTIGGYAFE